MPDTGLKEQISSMASSAGTWMSVPALKGHMGGADYYVITLPFAAATRYIETADPNQPAEMRENRRPSPARYGVISRYIRNNPDDYRFSAITCTFGKDGTKEPMKWEPPLEDPSSRIGILTLDQRDPLVIVDGQHRFGAIQDAIEEDPSLREEDITVVLFPYLTVQAAQQLFSDLNRTAKKTTKSLDILFDKRDVVNRIAQQLVKRVSTFGDLVNLEDASVPTNSEQMFTLAAIYQATKPIMTAAQDVKLLPEVQDADDEGQFVDFLVDTWEFISEQFPEWAQVATGELDIRKHRSDFLHWNSGVLSAVGEFVGETIRVYRDEYQPVVEKALCHPENYGWRRDREEWQGIATAGNLVLPRSSLRAQLRVLLKCRAGMPLSEAEQEMILKFPEKARRSLLAASARS